MRRLLLAVTLVACGLAHAAHRLPDRHPDRFERMTPRELFDWAMAEPAAHKPWRVVHRIEMNQSDPVAWGWRVSLDFQRAYHRRWPDKAPALISKWELAAKDDDEAWENPIGPGYVTAATFHLIATDGDCGAIPKGFEW